MNYSLPNLVSLLRIVIAPIFYILIISSNVVSVRIGCLLYAIGAITDYFDGWLARRYYEVTAWGKFFDPLADKILTTSAFLAFVSMNIIPFWMVMIIIIRDFGTTGLRIYADIQNKPIITSLSAKWKTFIQMLFIAYILLLLLLRSISSINLSQGSMNYFIYSRPTILMMLVLTIFTIWTAIEYIYYNRDLFRTAKD